jgi:hypothetical protein
MRSVYTTTVNVVNDRFDRTNVVRTLSVGLQRLRLCLRLCLREASGCALALAKAKRIAQSGLGAMSLVPAGSPSWGGHRPSGGPGHPSRS